MRQTDARVVGIRTLRRIGGRNYVRTPDVADRHRVVQRQWRRSGFGDSSCLAGGARADPDSVETVLTMSLLAAERAGWNARRPTTSGPNACGTTAKGSCEPSHHRSRCVLHWLAIHRSFRHCLEPAAASGARAASSVPTLPSYSIESSERVGSNDRIRPWKATGAKRPALQASQRMRSEPNRPQFRQARHKRLHREVRNRRIGRYNRKGREVASG